ncbi:MAG: sulfatase-like hydrolase/transferase, partial [Mariniphaga sp.]
MIRISLVFSVAAFGAMASPAFAKTEQTKKPNILFILADDYGWSDMSCSGSKYYETPHLDQLAAEGVRFTNAYSACSVCSPSRATILTG